MHALTCLSLAEVAKYVIFRWLVFSVRVSRGQKKKKKKKAIFEKKISIYNLHCHIWIQHTIHLS